MMLPSGRGSAAAIWLVIVAFAVTEGLRLRAAPSEHSFAGTFHDDVTKVTYSARLLPPGTLHAEFVFQNLSNIALQFNLIDGMVRSISGQNVTSTEVTPEQRLVLAKLAAHIDTATRVHSGGAAIQTPPHTNLLLQTGNTSNSESGHNFSNHTMPTTKRLLPDSSTTHTAVSELFDYFGQNLPGLISKLAQHFSTPTAAQHHAARHAEVICLRPDTTAVAHWTDKKGKHSKKVIVGSMGIQEGPITGDYRCMGMCGPGCVHLGFYTQKCLDHDTCSLVNHAHGGYSDENCGAAFGLAAYDFVIGALVCPRYNA
eukprot:gnl/TRDRNA2_/TRDRNA2_28867_c0_seq1.p1 gnl/TRDRNA2_/TRDRNA2_28867_c0~~gnl/TRDRNA2_/TRDRNA2_28867_c0_seq1.p1  ORF type:complete len:313 (-),score=20.91 gnl/TRDRNA2_/TRDRNA2_28867_c0_seq1:22-960(-)